VKDEHKTSMVLETLEVYTTLLKLSKKMIELKDSPLLITDHSPLTKLAACSQ
jgi:hypothetical protein